jgi:hypothetical protein
MNKIKSSSNPQPDLPPWGKEFQGKLFPPGGNRKRGYLTGTTIFLRVK